VAVIALALAIKLLLDPLIEEESPFLLLAGAVVAASLYGGLGPGLLAAVLAALVGDLFFLSPAESSLLFNDAGENVRLGMFALEAALVVALSTRLRFAMRQSESAERRYRELVDDLEGIVWEADARTLRFTFVGRQAEGMLGYPVERWLEDPGFWGSVVHPEDRERVLDLRRAAVRECEDHDLEYRAVAADGRMLWLRDLAYVAGDARGRAAIVRGLLVDVTERKRAESALREVREAERSRIARDLHDAVLQDLAYGLKEVEIVEMISPEPDGRLEHAIEALRRAGHGLRDAIYDLRLGDTQDQPFPRLLELLVELNRRMALDREIELVVEGEFPSAPLGTAGVDLLRVFQEALTNVRRHSAARRVRVELGVRGDELHAEVADDGKGFEPGTGTGIGLTGMRERAVALGGELEVLSEPGKGTRVQFRTSASGLLERVSEETGAGGRTDGG
jgi:PAS domain S-box-containing protein